MSIAWLMLPESRSFREIYWLSQMPGSVVTAIGETPTQDPALFAARRYRRLTRRFVEAGALAWIEDLDSVAGDFDWVASLELCALITGQAAGLARRRGSQQAVLTWGNDHRNPLYRLPPYREALHRALRADLFICFIEAARQHCIALGVDAERCVVVHPPLDTDRFHPAASPAEEPIAIFVSPLAPNKGIDRVLDAFDLLRRAIPDAKLRVVGDGPLAPLVHTRAAASAGSIEILGPQDRDGVAEALRQAAVFVTAPRPTRVWNEQFGLAYAEAMASGLPVVTTICGTSHEVVRAPNLRVEDDVEALADGLRAFLDDPSRRVAVGAHNRAEAVQRYAFRQQVERMGEAFASATHRSSSRARF
jgi:glycosyltransferase involved in cell wall biosynthesis